MKAYEFINENIDFKEEGRDNLPLMITKLECKILMEKYHEHKLKLLGIADVVLSEERTELPEVGCMNSLGCACKEANGYPLTDCAYWQGN